VPFWTGLLSGSALMTVGHILMLPLMVVAMLRRRDEYASGHRHGQVSNVQSVSANETASPAGALFGQFHPGLTIRTRHDNSQRMARAHDRLTNQSRGLSRCCTGSQGRSERLGGELSRLTLQNRRIMVRRVACLAYRVGTTQGWLPGHGVVKRAG
jgi:hypothetical protein